MEQSRQDPGSPAQAATEQAFLALKSRRDRVIKLAFLAVTVVLVTMVYFKQRGGLDLPGWGDDLSAALSKAAAEKRPVLAFFVSSPPDHISRELTKNTIPKNAGVIEKGRFVKVVVKVGSVAKSEPARRFGITSLPTMLVIGPDGVEKNRREGFIGEMEFRSGFLEGGVVIGPASSTKSK
jgi:hypothetical protein